MGYIAVRPRDAAKAKGFRGLVFPYPWADQVIKAYEEMGGAEYAKIEIVRRKDGDKVDVRVYKPPERARGD